MAKQNIIYNLKLFLNSSSLFLIVFGIIRESEDLVIVGSIMFLISLFFTTLYIILLAKNFKDRTSSDRTPENESGLNDLFEGLIVIYGLIALVISEPVYFNYSGQLIWFGTILYYILNGIIVSWIMNIPLKMTYGGWRVRYKKRYKRKG
ncbi:MAG: hypothetical protein M9904_19230 [Chitinophagaceae bacterium]|nr:hypothetical protein [Chitinophagaceae bacterium]